MLISRLSCCPYRKPEIKRSSGSSLYFILVFFVYLGQNSFHFPFYRCGIAGVVVVEYILLPLLLLISGFLYGQQDSLDIKIGQMLMIGFPGTSISADDPVMSEIKQGKVGGIVFFEKNIAPERSMLTLKDMIWRMQSAADIPLLIAIDQEGGRVNRMKTKYGFPKSVTAEYLGTQPLDSTRYYAELTAGTLAATGINVNFAPVVDLAINPDNPIIAGVDRSYSADAENVTARAAEVIKAHRKSHIGTALKHFPGHGSSVADTHLGMADVTDTWLDEELDPYRTLEEKGMIDGVMSSHIVNRKLDPEGLPGTLSKPILTDLLRNRIGYDGVIYSDDMQMKAITLHYGLEKAIELGINAGLDVLIFSNNIQESEERTVDTVHRIIRNLVESGAISEERINESYQRIIRLKLRLEL
ncbi:MAG: glycoside hydrolase family 3 N-terminal domain-containing protein [Cyclobacteriaceae bacterium]